jgi:hypothetical protein
MIFMNMNLDSITCMQNFDNPLEVAIGLNLIIENDLNLNMKLVLGFHL